MRIKSTLSTKLIYSILIGTLLSFVQISCKQNQNSNQEEFISFARNTRNKVLERDLKRNKSSSLALLDSIKVSEGVKPNSISDFEIECIRAEIYQFFGDIDSVSITTNLINKKLINLGEVENLPTIYARVYFQLSDINYKLKNYADAYRLLYLGKKIGANAADNYVLSEYYYRLAMIQYKQEFYLKAANSFQTSFEKAETIQEKNYEIIYRQQEVLDNIGLSYFKANNLDSAEVFYNKALAFIESPATNNITTLNTAKGIVIGNLGQLYAAKKDYTQAIKFLNKSISINKNEYLGRFDALLQAIELGNVYLKINQFDSVKKVINQIDNQVVASNELNAKTNFYKLESDYYKGIGDIEMAYFSLEKRRLIEEEIKQNDKNLKKVSIIEQINSTENEINFDSLEKKSNSKTVALIIFGICLTFTIIIITITYLNLKRSKKNIKILERLNSTVNKQANELKVNNLEKDKILRVVAHDLRNPIGGINSIAKIMLLDELSDSDKEMVELIDNTSKDALILINDILEFTNDSHHTDHVEEKISINHLISNAVALLKYKTTEKKQNLVFELPKKDIFVKGDREKLNRVINNLINNASKFSHQDKTIEIRVEVVQKMAIISVKDQGIGIQEEFRGSEIKALSGNKRRGTSGEKSFGMGLSIANQILKMHQGNLWFVSSSEGATFYVELPLYKD